MSHAATNWATAQRGLKPATKIVLWLLCDRHNPDYGCFPTQARLAEDAEMSISALNDHLATLEGLGLIRRICDHNPHTHRRMPRRFFLRFDFGIPQCRTPERMTSLNLRTHRDLHCHAMDGAALPGTGAQGNANDLPAGE